MAIDTVNTSEDNTNMSSISDLIREQIKQTPLKPGTVVRATSQAKNVYEGEVNSYNEIDGTLLLKNVSAFNTTDDKGLKKAPQKFHQITLWISKIKQLKIVQSQNIEHREFSDDVAVSSAIIKKGGDIGRQEKPKEWSPNPKNANRSSPFRERQSFGQQTSRMSAGFYRTNDRNSFYREPYFYDNMFRSNAGAGYYNNHSQVQNFRGSVPLFASNESSKYGNQPNVMPVMHRDINGGFQRPYQMRPIATDRRSRDVEVDGRNSFSRNSFNRNSTGFQVRSYEQERNWKPNNNGVGNIRQNRRNKPRFDSLNKRESNHKSRQSFRNSNLNIMGEESDESLNLEEVSKLTDTFISKELQEMSVQPKAKCDANILGDSVYYDHETSFFDELSRPSGFEKIDRKEERKKNLETFQGLNYGYRTRTKTGYVSRDLLETVSHKAVY